MFGAISDGLDGYYARNYNAISKLGKNLDPIADKILIQLAFISLFIISNVADYRVVNEFENKFVRSISRRTLCDIGFLQILHTSLSKINMKLIRT